MSCLPEILTNFSSPSLLCRGDRKSVRQRDITGVEYAYTRHGGLTICTDEWASRVAILNRLASRVRYFGALPVENFVLYQYLDMLHAAFS